MQPINAYFVALVFMLSALNGSAKSTCHKNSEHFQHNIQLILGDPIGLPVPGTEFWVTLDIVKDGPLVTINVPLINFQTGQTFFPPDSYFAKGGYLYTSDGFLPQELRPSDLVPRSIVAASNNGMSPVFSFTQTATELPIPLAGYIVQITNAGALQVQATGRDSNLIPPGPQILLPCSLSYVVKPQKSLCKNITLSNGATNVTQFPPNAAFASLRDSHVNDAFNGVAAWAWNDNSMQTDQSNGILNLIVAVADIDSTGNVTNLRKTQLTDFNPPATVTSSFSTAVAIVRDGPYKGNIVVSYTEGDYNVPFQGTISRAVSFDGGYTWPAEFNGPILESISGFPPNDFVGDIRGVSSDKFGNVWYLVSQEFDEFGNRINRPIFAVSADGGVSFVETYTVPFLPDFIPGFSFYDFPQYCFGGLGDGSDTYGLWFTCEFINANFAGDWVPLMGFIPISGFGLDAIGTGTTIALNQFVNTQNVSSITASEDGRVWVQANDIFPGNAICPQVLRYKSPGALDSNYAGPWHLAMLSSFWEYGLANTISYDRYFNTVQGNIYDEERQALYSILYNQVPDFSQNMEIYFIISRDNGATWSQPLLINTTNFANRAYASMALDTVTGDLVFGWWDGRNDTAYESLEYMAAVIPAKTLTELVAAIPNSTPQPLFDLGANA